MFFGGGYPLKACKIVGFTLAEVLITLGIIGVVAALTIPEMMTSYRRIVLDSQFRRAYSQLQQVIKLWQEQETEDLYSLYYDPVDKKGNDLRSAFYSYMKGTPHNYNIPEADLKQYYTSAKNSKTVAHKCPFASCVHPYNKGFTTFDGMMYFASARDSMINIMMDINGYDKGPNKWGVDLFDFDYTQDNVLKPPKYGCSHGVCNTYFKSYDTNVNDGIGCTSCALKDKQYFKKIHL